MLEYEDSDTLRHYKEFFYDVLPEFQKHGKVVEFKVSYIITELFQYREDIILYNVLIYTRRLQ